MRGRPVVLVVEDEDDLRELLGWLVASEGVDVDLAANGAEALVRLAARRPDLILLDMRMPVMDGWAFCAALDAQPVERPPIVVLTAAPDPAERAREVRAVAWLGKPFDPDELSRIVRRIALAPA